MKLGVGVDERCELDRLELDPVTFLSTPDTFLPMFLKDIATNKPNTQKDYVRVSENQVSCPRVSSPCGAWLPLTKIVLVGDNTPQNHSCGR